MKDNSHRPIQQYIIICTYCRKVIHGGGLTDLKELDEKGEDRARVSHGICPDCLLENFPSEYVAIQEERRLRIKQAFKNNFADFYGYIAQ